ncbi:MAG: outer membrane beta-barrel protein [Syntrophothermus sp.]
MKKIILIMSFLISSNLFAQSKVYTFTLDGGFGYSRFFSPINMENFNKNGYSSTLRLMWNPEHLLSAGIESGYYHLYTFKANLQDSLFGNSNAEVTLSSLPILLMFSMKILPNVKLFAGSGILLLFSNGTAYSDKFSTSQVSIADHVGASYTFQWTNKLAIGTEFKYTYIFKFEVAYVSLQLFAQYELFRW